MGYFNGIFQTEESSMNCGELKQTYTLNVYLETYILKKRTFNFLRHPEHVKLLNVQMDNAAHGN